MKNILVVVCTALLMSASCKPDVPAVPEDLLEKILTDGEWSVIDYKLNGVDKTSDFAGWRVKFYTSRALDAKFNTNLMNSGTWEGNQTTMNITINFPAPAAPLTLVTGTWHVDQPGTRIVAASQTVGTDMKTMKLYRE